jgi:hypothetical protein
VLLVAAQCTLVDLGIYRKGTSETQHIILRECQVLKS